MNTSDSHDHAEESDDDLDGCGTPIEAEDETPDEDLPAAEGGVA